MLKYQVVGDALRASLANYLNSLFTLLVGAKK